MSPSLLREEMAFPLLLRHTCVLRGGEVEGPRGLEVAIMALVSALPPASGERSAASFSPVGSLFLSSKLGPEEVGPRKWGPQEPLLRIL